MPARGIIAVQVRATAAVPAVVRGRKFLSSEAGAISHRGVNLRSAECEASAWGAAPDGIDSIRSGAQPIISRIFISEIYSAAWPSRRNNRADAWSNAASKDRVWPSTLHLLMVGYIV